MVADDAAENDIIEQARDVDRRDTRHISQESKALFQRRPALLLVLLLGDDTEGLAEVFLVQPIDHRRSVWHGPMLTVVAFDQQKTDAADLACKRLR